jgi:arylsulfatase
MAGEPDVVDKLKKGHKAATRRSRTTSTATTCCLPDRQGEGEPAQGFFYFSDDGDVLALRFDNWKIVFMEQRTAGRCRSGRTRS